MRARADLRREAKRDVGSLADALRGFLHKLNLVDRINVDRVDACADGFVQLRVRLACAVEDYLMGSKANAQCFEKFAAAVDFNVNAGRTHALKYPHVRVCFRGVAEAHGPVNKAACALQSFDVRADARL